MRGYIFSLNRGLFNQAATPFKNLKSEFPGVPLKIADHMAAIFQQKVVPRAAVVAAAIPK